MQNVNQLQAEAPILKHTTDLYAEFYGYWKLFPKKDQYLLGKRCEEYILHFLELTLLAVGSPRKQKMPCYTFTLKVGYCTRDYGFASPKSYIL